MAFVLRIRRTMRIAAPLVLSIPILWASCTAQAQPVGGAIPQSLADLNEAPTPGVEIPAELGAGAARRATAGGLPYESRGTWGMSPHARPEQVRAALEMAGIPAVPGPVEETWQSVHDHYRIPAWMVDGKVGIFIHFGLYSIPAHGSEWYQKHMYGDRGIRDWHIIFTGKGTCFIAGGVQDFEGMGRVARERTDFTWMVHESIAGSWGYVEGQTRARDPRTICEWLVDVVSKNGVLAMNVAPKGDGSISTDQQECLRAVDRWLRVNGEAIYGTRAWTRSGEGALRLNRGQRYSAKEIRFTTKAGVLYAILMVWPENGRVIVTSLPAGAPTGKPTAVGLLGGPAEVPFTQDAEGLRIQVPRQDPGSGPYALRIAGLKLE